jgi:hypothetical protein
MKEQKYACYSFKLSIETIKSLRKIKKKSGLSWNLFLYNNLIKNMGILDFVPREEFIPKKQKGDTELNCEKCGSKFMGFAWLLKSKKPIVCPRCWRYEKLDEEELN